MGSLFAKKGGQRHLQSTENQIKVKEMGQEKPKNTAKDHQIGLLCVHLEYLGLRFPERMEWRLLSVQHLKQLTKVQHEQLITFKDG